MESWSFWLLASLFFPSSNEPKLEKNTNELQHQEEDCKTCSCSITALKLSEGILKCFHVHQTFILRLISYAPSSRWCLKQLLFLGKIAQFQFNLLFNETFICARCDETNSFEFSKSFLNISTVNTKTPSIKRILSERKFLTCREHIRSLILEKPLRPSSHKTCSWCNEVVLFFARIISVLIYFGRGSGEFVGENWAEKKAFMKTGCATRSRTWL